MVITEKKKKDIIKLHNKGLSSVFIKDILHLPHTTDQISDIISRECPKSLKKTSAKKASVKKKKTSSAKCSGKLKVTEEHKKLIRKHHHRGLSAVDIREKLSMPYSVAQISAIKSWVTMRPVEKGE